MGGVPADFAVFREEDLRRFMFDPEIFGNLIGQRTVFNHMDNGSWSLGALRIGCEFLVGLGADRAGSAMLEKQFFTLLRNILLQFFQSMKLLDRHRYLTFL